MTGCDLVASAKPWKMQLDTVKYIFEEFYQQVVFHVLEEAFANNVVGEDASKR